MYKEIFQNFSDGHLIAIGFMLFMSSFLGSIVWTLFIQNKSFYAKLSQLPIEEGDQHGSF